MMFPIKYNGDVLHHNARVGVDGGIVESLDFVNDLSEQTKRVNMPLLLDIYPNAAAAYSLRKLRTAYTGAAIRVRRSSDNTETDIGFNNAGDLDTSALAAFVGNGNGFVSTWYDQSGTNNHATQTGTTEQPVVVSGGTIVTNNNKPAIQWVGSGSRMSAPSAVLASGTSLSAFYTYSTDLAADPDTNTLIGWFLGDGFISNTVLGISAQSGALNGEYTVIDVRRTNNGLERLGSSTYRRSSNTTVTENVFFLTGGTTLYQNRNLQSLDLTSAGASTSANYTPSSGVITGRLWLGAGFFSPSTYISAQAKFSEFIFYTTNQSPNRIGIETNINSYYKIYQQEALLLDYYPDAAAAYSLRKLRSGYTGAAIQVRRSSDNAVQNIGFDSNGGLDVTALTSFVGTGNTGFVSTWYDQSGNNRNATQTGTTAQPVIFSGGTVFYRNSKPIIQFNGSSQWLNTTLNNPFSFTGGVSLIHLSYKNATAFKDYETILSAGTTGDPSLNVEKTLALGYNNSSFANPIPTISTDIWKPSGIQYNGTVNLNSTHLIGYYISNWSLHRNTGVSIIRFNGNDIPTKTYLTLVPQALNTNPIKIGVYDTILASSFFAGEIQEIIAYSFNQSTNRPFIEANINSYYNIYPTDSDANAFVTAAGLTGTTQIQAVNKLVTDLKGYGLWGKMKAIYPFVGGTASSHKFNLKDSRDVDGAFRLVFSGGWTHSATGALPDGSTGWARPFFIPSVNLTNANFNISYYSRTNILSNTIEMGCGNVDGFFSPHLRLRFGADKARFICGNTVDYGFPEINNNDSRGYFIGTITSTSNRRFYKNSSLIQSNTSTITNSLFSGELLIGAYNSSTSNINAGFFSNKECAFATIGDGLTDTEAANLYTAVQAFQTTLGRQV